MLLLSPLPFITTSLSAYEDVVQIDLHDLPRSRKEALLILPGFGSRSEGVRDLQNFFSHRGYDLYIPDYIARNSLSQCVSNLDRFIQERKLAEYRKLHVFSFIIGAWTLNQWIGEHPENKIATIIYDRSPLQERAAYAMMQDSPFLTRVAVVPSWRNSRRLPIGPSRTTRRISVSSSNVVQRN
jgi:hypothetical protein